MDKNVKVERSFYTTPLDFIKMESGGLLDINSGKVYYPINISKEKTMEEEITTHYPSKPPSKPIAQVMQEIQNKLDEGKPGKPPTQFMTRENLDRRSKTVMTFIKQNGEYKERV